MSDPWGTDLREPRLGVMLHYDASASDEGSLAWLRDPRIRVSYNWLILDNGSQHTIAPIDARAWHAGVCRSSDPVRLPYKDANSAFYGISLAARPPDVATEAAKDAMARLVVSLFARHGWPLSEVWRIVGHGTEAWPRGRKIDPVGPDPRHPVLDPEWIRTAISAAQPLTGGFP